MIRTKAIVGVIAAVGLIALVVPGCDELITEVNEVTIAGHPEADFSIGGAGEDSGCIPFEVQFMDQSQGPITGWSWHFGDGDSSNDTNPVHTYDSAGVYNVILKVVHEPTEGEDTEEKKRYVVAGTTFADFVSDTNHGCVGTEISFQPLQYGGVTSWEWDFGDGTVDISGDSTPSHVYDSIGLYTVTLTIDNDECGSKTQTNTDMINITACPTVVIHADTPHAGCNPFTVQFYDSSTYDTSEIALTEWDWDFGDNTAPSTLQNPSHEYVNNGLYTVKLTVVGSTGGSATDSVVDMILVGDAAIADFVTISPDTGCYTGFQDFAVAFSDSSTGDIQSWQWSFGDGSESSPEQHPIHVFESPGTYSVTLQVTSSCGTDGVTKSNLVVLSERLEHSAVDYLITTDTITRDPIDTLFLDTVDGADTTATVFFVDSTPGVLGWDWDYGPSVAHGDESSVQYQYTAEGTWEVVLTLSNGCGEIKVYDTIEVVIP